MQKHAYTVLETIQDPGQLKTLNHSELLELAKEIRHVIIHTVSKNGGHLASNLGIVELTIALHRVFQSPEDKIVFDVGHQCYPHKLLTGRYKHFHTIRKNKGISGFPKRSESVHDAFDTGHASTSISAALGLLAGETLLGGNNHVIAVIGDGALTGGLAYEALSHAGHLQLPLIVILNDNKMSISPNVGALSKHLSRLTMTGSYQRIRTKIDRLIKKIPIFGNQLYNLVVRLKRSIKVLFYPQNFFIEMGFEYVGPIDGHNLSMLEDVLQDVKALNKPVVVHVITQKGRGYNQAEKDPSKFHGIGPFSVEDGLVEKSSGPAFTDAFGNALVAIAQKNPSVIAITAAMEKGTGLAQFHEQFPDRFFDVGIAEAHAVTFAAGLAARGLKPVVAIYSSFIQRSVDSVIHDVAIQNLPVTFAFDRAGFVPDDGETHQGLFDIALFRSVPHLALLAPASAQELDLMLQWSIESGKPSLIRYPKAACPSEHSAFSTPLIEGRGVFVHQNYAETCIMFTGSLYPQVEEALELLAIDGYFCDSYNIRFIKPLDETYLISVMRIYKQIVVVEEGMKNGGIGEHLGIILSHHLSTIAFLHLGSCDTFHSQATRKELLAQNELDAIGLTKRIKTFLNKTIQSKLYSNSLRVVGK
ncbi:1-deoxy-D-xylulose-5-phosphate synthase [Gracilinema caldarium]|uniref:1-deoxy-D-xylulose-5-phosphate synthase n=1 Tax=Gracilinema caldarium (strain ATCC 51460 / DSM 7334 / H1) TaxID=744872 RepID=F8F0K1_GRAC1|nr:1-deoxy-D-xylulose-5-phosphate synthase [Gracilinema caldarium]AEJ19345.1 1-deoxy-D-xylulose-5-phosphate synthase [Gracilinema caldarium DSM 7334]